MTPIRIAHVVVVTFMVSTSACHREDETEDTGYGELPPSAEEELPALDVQNAASSRPLGESPIAQAHCSGCHHSTLHADPKTFEASLRRDGKRPSLP